MCEFPKISVSYPFAVCVTYQAVTSKFKNPQIICMNLIAGACRWRGATYLVGPWLRQSEKRARRVRKITPKRGEFDVNFQNAAIGMNGD